MPDGKVVCTDEYVVQMKGINKVYPNGVVANQNVDFCLKKGEIHALMGENGAGKSTLMKMLFGLEQPTSGEIIVNGEKLNITSPPWPSSMRSAWCISTSCWYPACPWRRIWCWAWCPGNPAFSSTRQKR
ncbi:MAG: ATP-binding cassette domain-containing protein [Oscillospiraceae bacterium]